jgi:hypothetical protein
MKVGELRAGQGKNSLYCNLMKKQDKKDWLFYLFSQDAYSYLAGLLLTKNL